jgi:hypothetical protein
VGIVVVVEFKRTGPGPRKIVVNADESNVDGVDGLVVLLIDWLCVCQYCSATFEHPGVGTPSALVDRVIVAHGIVNNP